MTRSREIIIQKICGELKPLKQPVMDIVAAVTQRLELIPVMYHRIVDDTDPANVVYGEPHMPFAEVKSIATAAELFRVKFQEDKLGCLLKENMPMIFRIMDEHFEELEKMDTSGKRDIPSRFTADIAVQLTRDYSLRPTAAKENAVTTLVHEYQTGEKGKELRRAVADVRGGYAPPRYYPRP
jgi:hypothetical protein